MQIPKDQIIQMLRDRGDHDQADQADQNLPDQVDHEEHGGLLSQFGVDPQELIGGALGSGRGDTQAGASGSDEAEAQSF